MPTGFAVLPQLTLARQSETLQGRVGRVGVMMRIVTAALLAGFAGLWLPGAGAQAQAAPSGVRTAQASQPTEASAQRRRAVRRVPIYPRDEWPPDVYPRYYPGPNAVRECTATYVQEYRPSGTVITPRMSCHWRGG
jgi:hypothetical protein